MKYFLVTISILSCVYSIGQDYPTFPDSMAVWTNTETSYTWTGTMATDYSISSVAFNLGNSDTLISGQLYSQLFYEDSIFVGGIRTIDEKVYFNYQADSLEYLLYDFGSQVGDTVFNVFGLEDGHTGQGPWFYLVDYRVDYIDSVLCEDGLLHKRLRVMGLTEGGELEWIEGVGSTGGFLWLSGPNVSDYFVDLGRLCVNDQAIFSNYEVEGSLQDTSNICSSEYYISSIDEYERGKLSVYPNPASESIVIQENNLSQGAVFVLKDSAGRTIKELELSTPDQAHIDVSGCAKGTYIAIVRDNRSTYSTLLVIE